MGTERVREHEHRVWYQKSAPIRPSIPEQESREGRSRAGGRVKNNAMDPSAPPVTNKEKKGGARGSVECEAGEAMGAVGKRLMGNQERKMSLPKKEHGQHGGWVRVAQERDWVAQSAAGKEGGH